MVARDITILIAVIGVPAAQAQWANEFRYTVTGSLDRTAENDQFLESNGVEGYQWSFSGIGFRFRDGGPYFLNPDPVAGFLGDSALLEPSAILSAGQMLVFPNGGFAGVVSGFDLIPFPTAEGVDFSSTLAIESQAGISTVAFKGSATLDLGSFIPISEFGEDPAEQTFTEFRTTLFEIQTLFDDTLATGHIESFS